MDNTFIELTKERNKDRKTYSEYAYNSIIETVMVNNKMGKEKSMGLGEYTAEPYMPKEMIPGQIYTFIYKAEQPTRYKYKEQYIEFYDKLPLLLVLSTDKETVKGINLNLCNYELKTLILNLLYGIDKDFFESNAEKLAIHNQPTISKPIYDFINGKETLFLKYILDNFNVTDYSLIYRTYSKRKIVNRRYVEIWQWQHIPFLEYFGSIKQEILNAIYMISGFNNLSI